MNDTKLAWFEVLDRVSNHVDTWERHVADHNVLEDDKTLKVLADEILGKMAEFYQFVGVKFYDLDNS